MPNQDAWRAHQWSDAAVLVVADGLGSRPRSRLGARAACDAAVSAVGRWRRLRSAPIDLLLRLVHLEWQLRVHPHPPGDCATTCVLAVIDGRRLLLAQLGDGIALAADERGDERLPIADREFTNETTGLGLTRALADWRTLERPVEAGLVVMLATDGVSEELHAGREAAAARWLRDDIGGRATSSRHLALRHQLRELDAPGRTDDRTLALLWPTSATGVLA